MSALTNNRYAIIEAPSILGLKPTGVERLPEALLKNGLAERLKARRAERVEPPSYGAIREDRTLTLNAHAIAAWTPRLADAIARVLIREEFPLILGGDCSILLGAMLALKRRGRFGLLFIDGHADFYQPEANPSGEAASMELAFATGYGPGLLTEFDVPGPLVRPDDTVAFGFRDGDEQRQFGSQPMPSEILALDLMTVRTMGLEPAVAATLNRLSAPALDGFFIHLDADCLDDGIMPAVDYRLPGGFNWDELMSILTSSMASGRAVGLEVTIYNPALDADGSAGRGLTDALVGVLAANRGGGA